MPEQIIILDFGSQYTQLIARRIREQNIYCEIHPFNCIPPIHEGVKGVILSGSPYSVQDSDHPNIDFSCFGTTPVLGICYGAQLMVHHDGGKVVNSRNREFGKANLLIGSVANDFLEGSLQKKQVWMSHADTIVALPEEYETIASTESVPIAGFRHLKKPWYGVQFHPEVTHTVQGWKILQNFAVKICRCSRDWTPDQFVEMTVRDLIDRLGGDKVIMALSGGVDSTVAASLIHRAIGKNLYCVFVDNGLLRKDEFDQVMQSYQKMGLNVKGVDAATRFYAALQGVDDAEAKRKAIGKTFIEVFEEQSRLLPDITWLAQGTIYPDIIESKSVKGPSAVIKSHHNVGGLPDVMKLKLLEPLNTLFKDEVRQIGSVLKISPVILNRHPFPGPGLGIRVIGEVTVSSVKILQEADHIFINALRDFGLYEEVWQAGAVLLPVRSVGVMGDERTYENVVALRAVVSVDGMTANWAPLPHDFLHNVSSSIINNVRGINRVVYDISSKPPSTIEWE